MPHFQTPTFLNSTAKSQPEDMQGIAWILFLGSSMLALLGAPLYMVMTVTKLQVLQSLQHLQLPTVKSSSIMSNHVSDIICSWRPD